MHYSVKFAVINPSNYVAVCKMVQLYIIGLLTKLMTGTV